MPELIGAIVCGLALFPAGARWLRVAQREHYLPGSTSRFAWRWWSSRPLALPMAVVALAAAGVAFASPLVSLATAAVVIVGPPFLGVRGRTSPLAFTRRLRLLAGVWLIFQAVVIVIGVLVHHAAPVAALGACAVPLLVDAACAVLSPVERRLMRPYVTTARERLAQVAPVVVAITGSFGKTSTKQHVAHLVAGSRTVVASPASFNNRAGLARAVNEQLAPGTDVFVAEMGTYGKGEIADLCRWCPPEIAVITAIGPVHLERFKTEDAIVAAKAEITENAHTVVLNVDDPRLAALADRLAAAGGKSVVRCSATDAAADVCVAHVDVADGDVADVDRAGCRQNGCGWGSGRPLRHDGVRGRRGYRNWSGPAHVGAADQPRLCVGRGVRARCTAQCGARAYRRAPSRCQPARVGAGALGGVGDRRHVQLQPQRGPGRVGRTGPTGGRRPPCGRDPGHGRAGPPSVRGESLVRPRCGLRCHRSGDRGRDQSACPRSRVVPTAVPPGPDQGRSGGLGADHPRAWGRRAVRERSAGPLPLRPPAQGKGRVPPHIAPPVTHDPVTHDPVTHDPVTHDPVTHDPVTHDPVTPCQ